MRTFSGVVLLAGVCVGLFVYLPAPVDRNTTLTNAQQHSNTSTVAKDLVAETRAQHGPRSFSPAIALTSVATSDGPSVTRPDPLGGWSTTSASEPHRTLEPTSPESRYRLVVDLQQELKRVGCYWGRADGSWGSGTRHALQSFMARVNAALPSDEPDYLLLSLLKSQSGEVCGACPADQVQASGGRCIPQTTVAYGQPNTEATTAGAPSSALPWQTTTPAPSTKPVFTALPNSVVSTEPLPGRMAIGAPAVLPPVNSDYAPAAVAATDAAQPGLTAAEAPVETRAPSKPAKTYKKARRRDGPGTPRYNLMLSLGGVY
jgi:hypothetical protein